MGCLGILFSASVALFPISDRESLLMRKEFAVHANFKILKELKSIGIKEITSYWNFVRNIEKLMVVTM